MVEEESMVFTKVCVFWIEINILSYSNS